MLAAAMPPFLLIMMWYLWFLVLESEMGVGIFFVRCEEEALLRPLPLGRTDVGVVGVPVRLLGGVDEGESLHDWTILVICVVSWSYSVEAIF